MTHTTYILIAQ